MRESGRGFTLIELLVVLVIIGVLISLATVAFGDHRADELEREARRLVTVLELAGEESALISQPIGARIEPDGYGFYRYNAKDKKWLVIEDDRELRVRELPPPLELKLVVDKITVKEQPKDDKDKGDKPHLYFLPSGELTPGFEIVVSHPDLEGFYRVTGREDGKLGIHAEQ